MQVAQIKDNICVSKSYCACCAALLLVDETLNSCLVSLSTLHMMKHSADNYLCGNLFTGRDRSRNISIS